MTLYMNVFNDFPKIFLFLINSRVELRITVLDKSVISSVIMFNS